VAIDVQSFRGPFLEEANQMRLLKNTRGGNLFHWRAGGLF
jgi:hypothetical protein